MQEFTIFWLNNESEEIKVSTNNEQPFQSIYDDCGVSKSCIGLPNDCVLRRNCEKIVAVIVNGETYTFEMQTSASSKISLKKKESSLILKSNFRQCRIRRSRTFQR